jgi:hypothetical protein
MGTAISEFTFDPRIIPVTLSLPKIGNTEPGRMIEIPIGIRLSNNNNSFTSFANANITSFEIKLRVDGERKALYYSNNDFLPISGWTFTGSQDQDGIVTIRGNGSMIVGDGINPVAICIPRFQLLMSTLTDISFEITDFNVNDRECCVKWTPGSGSITSTICAQDARGGLLISNTLFSLPTISPNPYSSNILEFEYGVGIDDHLTLDIYNSTGKLVKSIFNGPAKIGTHKATTDISDFSSGAYTIIMRCTASQFETSTKLIILK